MKASRCWLWIISNGTRALHDRHAADAIAGGRWLGAWLTITAAVANSGSFLSEMSVTSQTLIGMAERGFLPSKLRNESPHGSYPWALATIAGIIALSQPFDFHALVLICKCCMLGAIYLINAL